MKVFLLLVSDFNSWLVLCLSCYLMVGLLSVNTVLLHSDCCCCCLVAKSCPTLLRHPWTISGQTPPSMGFSRQEYWSGLSFPPPGEHPDPGTKPESFALADSFFTTEPPGESTCTMIGLCFLDTR